MLWATERRLCAWHTGEHYQNSTPFIPQLFQAEKCLNSRHANWVILVDMLKWILRGPRSESTERREGKCAGELHTTHLFFFHISQCSLFTPSKNLLWRERAGYVEMRPWEEKHIRVYLSLPRPVAGRKTLAGAVSLVLPCVENIYRHIAAHSCPPLAICLNSARSAGMLKWCEICYYFWYDRYRNWRYSKAGIKGWKPARKSTKTRWNIR